jgi:hypothetical protein
MRQIILAATIAVGLVVLAVPGTSAMPANGVVIGQAASVNQLTQRVWYRSRYRYHYRHRYRYHRWYR